MPRGFSEHEKELIKARLMEESYKQFAIYGLKKTNIEELARAVGISKGAFYIFYPSKEALFMDVVEQAEKRFRLEVLAVIDLPGPSPRARLLAVLLKAFSLWKTIPILQLFTTIDYEFLFRSIPAERLQQHLESDRVFFEELVARCQEAGIPIQASAEEIGALLYPLVLAMLHEDDLDTPQMKGSLKVLLELLAAYCLGEVEIQSKQNVPPV